MKALSDKLVVGSACSGSEIARGVFDMVASILKAEVCAACTYEKEPWKRSWIQGVVEPALGEKGSPCCFSDIEHLNQSTAYGCTHVKQCRIKPCHVFSTGFSRRTVSKINSARGGKRLPCERHRQQRDDISWARLVLAGIPPSGVSLGERGGGH